MLPIQLNTHVTWSKGGRIVTPSPLLSLLLISSLLLMETPEIGWSLYSLSSGVLRRIWSLGRSHSQQHLLCHEREGGGRERESVYIILILYRVYCISMYMNVNSYQARI